MNDELQTKLSKIIEILQSLVENKPQQTKQDLEEQKYEEFLEIVKQGNQNKIYEWLEKNHKSKSEKIQEIAYALGIDKKHIQQDRAEKLATGNHDRFEIMGANITVFNLEILKNYDLDFFSCCFHCNIDLRENFRFLWFSGCQFQNIDINAIGENLIFNRCKFLGNFSISKGESCLDVEKCIFNEAFFKNSIFSKKISFKMCKFKNTVNFSRIVFKDQTSFYGTTFYSCPNFSQCRFEGNINLINTNLIFDYDNTYMQIIKAWKQERLDFKTSIPKQYVANDFRDSFRLFKNALSKEGNALDASNYHRVELYCKEIELDSKPQKSWQDRIDLFQLWFYRKTSEHHTDLLKIISWVVITIGFFGLALFSCKYGFDLDSFISNHSKNSFVAIFDRPFITQSKIIGLIYLFGFCSLFWKWSRIFFFSGIALCMTLISYKYILGIGSFLTSKTSCNPLENFLLVLYTIVMILLLFSLQKTARKNSIIPS